MDYKRLNGLWQTTGGLLAPVILTVLVIQLFTDSSLHFYQWLMWLHLPLLFLHEYEEYVVTPDGFKKFVNTDTLLALNPPEPDTPVNDLMIFTINMIGWVWAFLGALFATTAPWIGASFILLEILINVITHSVVFQLKRKAYNPGLVTTLVLLVPYITFVTWYIVAHNLFSPVDWVLTLIVGVGIAASLPSWSLSRNREMKLHRA